MDAPGSGVAAMGGEAGAGAADAVTRLRVGCQFDYESDGPVPAVRLVRARPDGEHHTRYESRWLEPDLPVHEYVDGFGNLCWRYTLPGGPVTIRYDAIVEVARAA